MGQILWVASYPKSGNTWVRAFLANLQAGEKKPLDINRIRMFSASDAAALPYEKVLGKPAADLTLEEVCRARGRAHTCMAGSVPPHEVLTVKTHVGLGRMFDTPTITPEVTWGGVYIIRNPLDVAVSLSHWFGADTDEAIRFMESEEIASAPDQIPQLSGTWSNHVRGWTRAPGMHRYVVRYEDLLAHPKAEFSKIADFLEIPKNPQLVKRAVKHVSFKTLQGQETKHGFAENEGRKERFFRTGQSGQWRERLTPEQIKRIIDAHGEIMAEFGYLEEAASFTRPRGARLCGYSG
ncbi:MAG: sulfotransferase domain-containing protein [Rhodospirillales bacterium]